MMKRMRPQQTDESTPQTAALVTARAREEKVQQILGPPPEPPVAPRGNIQHGFMPSLMRTTQPTVIGGDAELIKMCITAC